MRNGQDRVIGDLLNFRGMAHAPTNEQGVVALFATVARDLNLYIEDIGTSHPDCTVRRFNGNGWERLSVEFEFEAKGFDRGKRDPLLADMIVCWVSNWIDKPAEIEVLCLADEIKKLEQMPIRQPERMPF